MTQEEIIEGNKLIAEFMGYFPTKGTALDQEWWWTNDKRDTRCFKLSWTGSQNGFPYHTSWDWLMPVVQKINSMTPEIKMPDDLASLRGNTHPSSKYLSVCGHPICCPIELIHSEVVEFIKWYNSQSVNP